MLCLHPILEVCNLFLNQHSKILYDLSNKMCRPTKTLDQPTLDPIYGFYRTVGTFGKIKHVLILNL
jgi:hypothetical protein